MRVYPSLSSFKGARHLTKSSCSLLRFHTVAFAHHDWSEYGHSDELDGPIVPSAFFASPLSVTYLPSLPLEVSEISLSF